MFRCARVKQRKELAYDAFAVVIPFRNELDRDVEAVREAGSGVDCAETTLSEQILAAIRVALHQLSLGDHCINEELF